MSSTARRTRSFARGHSCAPQPRQRRPVLARPNVAATRSTCSTGTNSRSPVRVLQLQELALDLRGARQPVAADPLAHEPGEAGDAVLDVDDELARLQVGEEALARRAPARRRATLLAESEDLGVRQQRQARALFAYGPAVRKRSVHDGQRAAAERRRADGVRQFCEDVVLFQQLGQPLRLRRDDDHLLPASAGSAPARPPARAGVRRMRRPGRTGSRTAAPAPGASRLARRPA